jgi:glyoxylase-like metal-dependent hydrolase (beta-lactamase superfamily II)
LNRSAGVSVEPNRNTGTCSNRRDVLVGLAGLGVASFARAQDGLGVAEVAPKVRVLSGAGGNIVVLATSAGQVVVDGGAAAHRDAVMSALAGANVAALVNTHWHRDQTGANEALGAAGATIIAHDKTRQRLTAGWYVPAIDSYEAPLPAVARPTRTFFTADAADFGGDRVEFGYLIEAHTDGDVYVRFPQANVIAAGDVLSPQHDPVLDWFGGGWLGGRVDALAKLLELGDARTRYVPSVGPAVGRAEVQAEHDLMKTIFDRMVVNLRLGQTAEDMLTAGVLDGLPRMFADPGKFLYDANKGFWAHHNKLVNDIV